MKSLRLPAFIKPMHYSLFFDIDLKQCAFAGKETIDIEITKPTKAIVVHASGLNIQSALLVHGGERKKPKTTVHARQETVTLQLNTAVKGKAQLCIEFTGRLNDDLLGFYRSAYVKDGKKCYLATTQFEAPYARRAFPCFDEPELKATFDVSLATDRNLQALSNMPVRSEVVDGDRKIVAFERTPRMSTYLLYMAAGEFEFLEGSSRGTKMRIVTLPGKKEQAAFALDIAKKFLGYFEDYSGIRYPLPKLDMIALPDFAAGAMENWGAITYREVYLLFDPSMTSTAIKQRIAMIIAHELWHMWSGDLVTMEWWDDLWLNESFATYMAYKAVDHFFPEWRLWNDFIRDEMERAFDDDSLKTTHPVAVSVKDPHQIEEIFDAISYAKGGSVLRMLERYVGEKQFRSGVSAYLKKHQYGNATSENLWDALAEASEKPIRKVAMHWIKQAGHPLIEVSRNKNLLLRQRQFVFGKASRSTWSIPLLIKSGSAVTSGLFEGAKKGLPATDSWCKVNYGQAGFYRVQYSDDLMEQLAAACTQLPVADRWGLQSDLFSLCMNGDVGIDSYFRFIAAYGQEREYLVLSSLYGSMKSIWYVFFHEKFWKETWPAFKKLHDTAFRSALDRLGWDPRQGESKQDALLRDLALRYLGFAEDSGVITQANEKFEAYRTNKAKLHPDIKASVFITVAAQGNEETYECMLSLYREFRSPEEARTILVSLGQFRNERLLQKTLDFAVSAEVRTQDVPIVFASVAANPLSRRILLPWVKKNWKKLERYKKSGKIFIHLLETLIGSRASREEERELRSFFKTHPLAYRMTLARSFERLKRTIAWREKNRKALAAYFLAGATNA
ncbi:MAG: M1 family metallopeptidase [Candidatus Aenigmarchaeota archaeon]|nr:M1 family metallopeptidase [Candidatus Aenigmarchaeota archaeon]